MATFRFKQGEEALPKLSKKDLVRVAKDSARLAEIERDEKVLWAHRRELQRKQDVLQRQIDRLEGKMSKLVSKDDDLSDMQDDLMYAGEPIEDRLHSMFERAEV